MKFYPFEYFECHDHTEIIACDPPSPPSNGYIMPYTSTVEGASVTYVFQYLFQMGQQFVCAEVNVTAVCNNNGYWEPNSEEKQCPKTNNISGTAWLCLSI